MLERYYFLWGKFCGVNKLEKLDRDAESLYLALAEKNEKKLDERIHSSKRAEWNEKRNKDCGDGPPRNF